SSRPPRPPTRPSRRSATAARRDRRPPRRAVQRPADRPPPGGKWIDVDLDEQVATAYEGATPVYATMVSTGNPKWPTAPGVYRIRLKLDETDMNGQMGDEQPYSVATVPWTMFFARDLGFHTAYWHDRFGEARSHGCIHVYRSMRAGSSTGPSPTCRR